MRLAGMSDDQIRQVDTGGAVQPRFTITSPINGVVGELFAREGMTVAAGAPLFRLNGLATVWVNAEVPEGVAAEETSDQMPEQTALDKKINQHFAGVVVRKDLVKAVKGNAIVRQVGRASCRERV